MSFIVPQLRDVTHFNCNKELNKKEKTNYNN